jgi:hypothetical protein
MKKHILCSQAMSDGQSTSLSQENVHIPPPQFALSVQQKPPKQSPVVLHSPPGPPPQVAGSKRHAEFP